MQISSKATAVATEKEIGTLEAKELVRIWLFLLARYPYVRYSTKLGF